MGPLITVPDAVAEVGFFADVHADLGSLLRLMRLRPGVEAWFCAGDVVDVGKPVHHNAPALRLLTRLSVPSVLGNHDRAVLRRDGRRLDAEARAYLEALPPHLDLAFAGMRIRIVHATPTSLDTFVRARDGERAFLRHFVDQPADVFVLGHTHEPFDLTFGGKRFLNPGALAHEPLSPPSNGPSYAVLDAGGAWTVPPL